MAPAVAAAPIDQLVADMHSPFKTDAYDDSSLESAAADNELVKFVNKAIIDAYNQKVFDSHFDPMPGKAKTVFASGSTTHYSRTLNCRHNFGKQW